MSEAQSIVGVQLEELLKLVANYRDEKCDHIRERARAGAVEIVNQARHNAQAQMRTAIKQERARAQETIASTRAHLLTSQRQRQQHTDKLLVEQGWEKLSKTLIERWRDSHQRYLWLEALVLLGVALLPVGRWHVEHPPGWDTSELSKRGNGTASVPLGPSPTFAEDASIEVGLRIEVGGARLDGTMDGLLANRASIEAMLLAEVSRPGAQS